LKIITAFAAGLVLIGALPATPASALNARSFVSGHGNDANICTFAAPCRTFAAAYAKTAPSGEISVLDPAGYGQLTISHALSIVNDGVGESSIVLIAAGNAITINAGATDAVSLRGLTIDGSGVGTAGIQFNSGKSLTVQKCIVRNLNGSGIAIVPNTDSAIVVSDTVVMDNTNNGIYVQPTGLSQVTAIFNRVEAYNNGGVGIGLYGNSASTGSSVLGDAIDSVAAHNHTAGFYASKGGTVTVELTMYRSSANQNFNGSINTGVRAENGGIIYVAQSNLMHDFWSVDASSTVYSFGDNYITSPPPNGITLGRH
jgi:hypothetical protein